LMSMVFSYDPVGWGVPYGGFFASGTEEDLVDVALQVLCIVMDFDPAGCPPGASEGDGVVAVKDEAPDGIPKVGNVYRYMLKNIKKEKEIELIFSGIVKMLTSVYQSNQTMLPGSFRSVGFYQEALVLLWHLVTLNPAFVKHVVDQLPTNQIVLPVLYLLQQAQGSPQLVGLLHTASFVLLVLSSERSFSVRLNEPYTAKVPLVMPSFQGCHADVVCLALYKVISDNLGRPQSDALVEMLLTVLCNISPYVKCFSLESCLKLLSLVDRCSRPSYVFRSAYTHHGLIFLMELVTNVVQYQFEGNAMLIYSVLRQKEIFQQCHNLDIEAWKARKARKQNGNGVDATATGGEDGVSHAEAEEAEVSWAPTEEWFSAVKNKMSLQTIMCLVDHLTEEVEKCKKDDVIEQADVLKYLKQTTMVGILPVPHAIVIRSYQASSYTSMWFTSYMWGVIFTRSQKMPLYDWRKIRLVVINQ
jgi:hypothetical protein